MNQHSEEMPKQHNVKQSNGTKKDIVAKKDPVKAAIIRSKRESRLAQWKASKTSELPDGSSFENKRLFVDVEQAKLDAVEDEIREKKEFAEQVDRDMADLWKRQLAEAEQERAMLASMTPMERQFYDATR